MRSLLLFLYRYRAFLVFILLQFASFFLVVQNSNYNRATFFNSTNYVVGNLLETSSNVSDYINLDKVNEQLIKENATLREKNIFLLNQIEENDIADTLSNFSFINSKVIKNSVFLLNNIITINSGSNEGISTGMGVLGNGGIVGKVKRVGKNYSTIVSLLDIDVIVSAEIKDIINLCTVQWDGHSSKHANVLYVPRHYKLALGDSVITSGYNAIYPPGIPIGTISKVDLPDDATFYTIEIELINNFESLSLVEVVINKDLPQIDSLTITIEE